MRKSATIREFKMGSAETTAADAINRKVKEVAKIAKKFNFQDTAKHVAELKILVEKANALPGANPHLAPEDFEYPLPLQSAYLKGDKPAAIVSKIEEVVPAHACNCDPVKCACSSSNETVCQTEGTSCEFCNEKIAVEKPLHISEATGAKMCGVCARILWEKVRLKESVVFAVVNLVEDAATESDPPYLQFKAALKLVEEAQSRLEQFRLTQRAKVAR
jgi:hypothetical protein